MRAVQDELFETLAEQGHPDVRPRHGMVLAFLDPEGTRATELSQRSGPRARAILAAIEHRHEQSLGTEDYTGFKTALQRITRLQRQWRDARAAE
ncbi:hypothetical protein AB0K00_29895 [Dactylosporangium sp. NPDC049525]|uniref:hypothetical protein n=1 Tax=Dactylosporangium sp. NPDC049525 TaxID=3154730 RepID=UPI0034266580